MGAAEVLIAEDEVGIRTALAAALRAGGHTVHEAANGLEAFDRIAATDFDVVVLDLRMPGRSGLEVARAVHATAPETEILVTSAVLTLESVLACLRAGVLDVLEKPVPPEQLLDAVDRALARRDARASASLGIASEAIFATDNVERLPELIVTVALDALQADHASLMLPASDDRLYIAYSKGLPAELAREVSLGAGERVAGRIAASRTPVLITGGLSADPRFAGLEEFSRVSSSIVYPLVAGNRLVGVLNVGRADWGRPFRRWDLQRAGVLASQVLLAIENARLVRRMMAAERLATLGHVAAGIAHEINNPVSYALGHLELVREATRALESLSRSAGPAGTGAEVRAADVARFTSDLQQSLADVEEGVRRIRDIVGDMRSLGRSGPAEVYDASEAVRLAVRMAGAEVRAHAVLQTRLGDDLAVVGSAGQLSQVIVNLLANATQAIQATGERGRHIVVVVARRAGEAIEVEVSDDGPGMPPHTLHRIFEPFFTTKEACAGSGLGLHVSREILRQQGGEISVRSSPGAGTTFTIRLPAAPVARDRRAAPESAGTGGAARRVLFVDDEPAMLRMYERVFGARVDVTCCGDGAEVLERVEGGEDFDLVVCDLLMPNVSGMDLFRRLLAARSPLCGRFVFVTGSRGHRAVREFVETVTQPVLEKPVNVEVLRELVEHRATSAVQP